MDSEILEQLKTIAAQLEKITGLLEEKKSFSPKRAPFADRKPFGAKKPFGPKKPFGARGGFAKRPAAPRFNEDGSARFIADGRGAEPFKKRRKF